MKTDPFYNSKEWKQIRNSALERDNCTCQMCGYVGKFGSVSFYEKQRGERPLVVHHIKERRDGGSDELDNLKTLCTSCHSSLPKKQETRDKIRKARKEWVPYWRK